MARLAAESLDNAPAPGSRLQRTSSGQDGTGTLGKQGLIKDRTRFTSFSLKGTNAQIKQNSHVRLFTSVKHPFRLFERIGAVGRVWRRMKKGSPRDCDAETGCLAQSAQKSQLGEPHECYPLYRIGRTQENHQLLCKDGSRAGRLGRQTTGIAYSSSKLGGRPAGAVAWCSGSDPFQCLDLRHPEALRAAAGDGPASKDEGYQREQKEERFERCTNHRRPAPLRSVADLLCVTAGDARSQAAAALSQYAGTAACTHAEQDGRSAHGERNRIPQRQAARQEILFRSDEEPGGGPESVKDLLRMSRSSM
jgi:hypothetical protein